MVFLVNVSNTQILCKSSFLGMQFCSKKIVLNSSSTYFISAKIAFSCIICIYFQDSSYIKIFSIPSIVMKYTLFLQLRLAKDRKKGDKIVSESQEKAYWRVYRPPPGFTTVVEASPVPSREQRVKARNRTFEHLTEEVCLKMSLKYLYFY